MSTILIPMYIIVYKKRKQYVVKNKLNPSRFPCVYNMCYCLAYTAILFMSLFNWPFSK